MRTLAIFAVGLAVGYAMKGAWQPESEPKASGEDQERVAALDMQGDAGCIITVKPVDSGCSAPQDVRRYQGVEQLPVSPVVAEMGSELETSALHTAQAAPTRPRAADQEVTLRLSEGVLESLEADIWTLRQTTAAESTLEGWRVRFYRANNALERAGLRSGDLITLDGLRKSSQDPRLVARFLEILNQISI